MQPTVEGVHLAIQWVPILQAVTPVSASRQAPSTTGSTEACRTIATPWILRSKMRVAICSLAVCGGSEMRTEAKFGGWGSLVGPRQGFGGKDKTMPKLWRRPVPHRPFQTQHSIAIRANIKHSAVGSSLTRRNTIRDLAKTSGYRFARSQPV